MTVSTIRVLFGGRLPKKISEVLLEQVRSCDKLICDYQVTKHIGLLTKSIKACPKSLCLNAKNITTIIAPSFDTLALSYNGTSSSLIVIIFQVNNNVAFFNFLLAV